MSDQPYVIGETLPKEMHVAEMCRAFRISRSQFHRLQRKGKFDRFELSRIGARAWSGSLVQKYFDCEHGASRFVLTSRARRTG